MRPFFSCLGISTALMLLNFSSIASDSSNLKSYGLSGKTIYGLSNTKHFKASSNGDFYIQTATFKSKQNAYHYKSELIKKYHHPVIVKNQGGYYIVFIGPLHSAAEVRALNSSSGGKIVPVNQEITKPVLMQKHHDKHQLVIGDKDAAIAPLRNPNHFEVIGAVGIANLEAEDGYLVVTSDETDQLIQTNHNDWNNFTGQLGIGYVYYLHGAQQYSENLQWFPWIEPELNGYYLSRNNIRGDVWRFSDSEYNDFSYTMPTKSSRLMMDVALTVLSKKQFSLFALGGIGNSWNRVGYRDAPRNNLPCPEEYLNLNSTSRSSFSWEAGAGLSFALNSRFALSLEYLYADSGKVKTPTNGFGAINTYNIAPADFKLTTQSALLALHVTL
ncbi:MAG: SPOR domain-containing protein [Tatlockia sp.]|nr:SPOR domain-containing protein [Tatlockia sp.]